MGRRACPIRSAFFFGLVWHLAGLFVEQKLKEPYKFPTNSYAKGALLIHALCVLSDEGGLSLVRASLWAKENRVKTEKSNSQTVSREGSREDSKSGT
jgi:hypothetical protein